MSFAMVTDTSKKIRCIDDDGNEVYEDDDPYAFLRFQEAGQLRPAKKPKQLELTSVTGVLRRIGKAKCCRCSLIVTTCSHNPKHRAPINWSKHFFTRMLKPQLKIRTGKEAEDEEEDEKPDPELAIAKLEAASSELAVLFDLIENVLTLRAVMVQYADARRDESKKKADVIRNKANMVKDKALQVCDSASTPVFAAYPVSTTFLWKYASRAISQETTVKEQVKQQPGIQVIVERGIELAAKNKLRPFVVATTVQAFFLFAIR